MEDYPQEMVSQDSDEQWEMNDGYNAYQESLPREDLESPKDMPITGQDANEQGKDH